MDYLYLEWIFSVRQSPTISPRKRKSRRHEDNHVTGHWSPPSLGIYGKPWKYLYLVLLIIPYLRECCFVSCLSLVFFDIPCFQIYQVWINISDHSLVLLIICYCCGGNCFINLNTRDLVLFMDLSVFALLLLVFYWICWPFLR